MEKSDFDLLMERYVRGQVSDHERKRIEAWLDSIGTEDNTDLDLSREEEDRIFRKLTSEFTTDADIAALKPKRQTRVDRWVIRIAASLLIIALGSYVAWHYAGRSEDKFEVASGKTVEKVILSDGSLVWLRGGSKVAFYKNEEEGTRYTTFEGEALFEVARDADHPFIVQCGDAHVTVLGTTFNIKALAGRVEVTVLRGRVNLSSSVDRSGIDVLPEEKAVYKSDGTIEKVAAAPKEIASAIKNTEYDMQFSSALMSDLVERLGSKFNVAIELSGESAGSCRITVDLTDQSLEESLQLISEILPITYSVQERRVVISGTGCR